MLLNMRLLRRGPGASGGRRRAGARRRPPIRSKDPKEPKDIKDAKGASGATPPGVGWGLSGGAARGGDRPGRGGEILKISIPGSGFSRQGGVPQPLFQAVDVGTTQDLLPSLWAHGDSPRLQ